ncbi:AraC family transcriptional regulator [Polaribacter sp. ALD11]|uniref:helix-turn-helix domain-containing protein n=1 Tax=Polaribacter sp. ALD11 TaxID=2058137 RepID=UPI000C30ADE7|nr:helix-turn-helix domain-containing protein [Polaribacter sp. ALD11]AUC84853.1 AraC family transcriptional regulator [Polaribacter sp. ALD11]
MIFTTFLNIAIFQGIVLGIIILKSILFKSTSNKYLAYAIFTLSLLLLNFVFAITNIYNTIPFLIVIDNIEWTFVFPVYFFLFVINQVHHPIRQSKKIRLLFLPFLFSVFINVFNDLDKVFGIYKLPNSINKILEGLIFSQYYIFPIFIIGILSYIYPFIKFSNDAQEKKWITYLWASISILLLSFILTIFTGLIFQYDISYFMKFLALFATFIIHWTSYFGVFKYKLAKDKEDIRALLSKRMQPHHNDINIKLQKKTSLDKNESMTEENPYFKKLESLCQQQHIYRDNTINREKIAEMLGISAGYVSQLVNTITGQNFSNYINYYRIEAVKGMIFSSEFEKYNLLTIGLESGFTSKTTFYNAFKKATGMTPNEYRKIHIK